MKFKQFKIVPILLICGMTSINLNAQASINLRNQGFEQLRVLADTGRWSVYPDNPVLQPGAKGEWDAGALGSMTVLKVGGVFHLYYEAWGVRGDLREDYSSLQIGHATSKDGLHWTKDPANPVLPKGKNGEWDSDGTWDPYVLYEDGVFKMWYGGGMEQHCDWGYAVSADGLHFEKKGQISLLGNVEDDHVVHDKTSGHYFMYYWDRKFEPSGLFRAESPNETDFDFAKAQPVKIEGLNARMKYKFTHVIQNDGQWEMFFGKFVRPGCKDCSTGFATSTDGLNWTSGNTNLLVGIDGEVLNVTDNLWMMFYGRDGFFDQAGQDIRVALYKGKLADQAMIREDVTREEHAKDLLSDARRALAVPLGRTGSYKQYEQAASLFTNARDNFLSPGSEPKKKLAQRGIGDSYYQLSFSRMKQGNLSGALESAENAAKEGHYNGDLLVKGIKDFIDSTTQVDEKKETNQSTPEGGQPLSIKQLRDLAGTGHWAIYPDNPIIQPGAKGEWDAGALGSMTVLKVGEVFHMYYEAWGVRGSGGLKALDYITLQIGHATSRDGLHWIKDPANPVLRRGTINDINPVGTWDPFVIYEDGVFKMWYGGRDQWGKWGYATSEDGTHFTRIKKFNLLEQCEDDHVIHDKVSGRYFMYNWNRDYEPMGLFRAASSNETDFDFAHAEPIRIEGLKYPMMYKFPNVIKDGGKWYMFFAEFIRPGCKDCRTGYATSPDGLHWTVRNPNLLVGHDGEVLKVADDLWLMYYGKDGLFDQAGCDIRVALFKGKLDDLTGKK